MGAPITIFLILLIGAGSRGDDSIQTDTLADQEVHVPDDGQLGDLALQNLLTYLVQEKERLERELDKVRGLVTETKGSSETAINNLEGDVNASLIMAERWKEDLRMRIAENSVKIEQLRGASLENLKESFRKAEQLEKSLNQTRAEAEQLRTTGELCERQVKPLDGQVKNLTEKIEQLTANIMKKLVTTFNRQRVWRALRGGLEAVMDTTSTTYSQLQRLGYDKTNPLQAASEGAGYEAMLEMLLEAGLDPDMAVGSSDWTMLHYSTYNNKVPIAELLLRHGAHMEMKSDVGRTPLVQTAWDNRLAGLKLLVERGAYINSVDKEGRSSLHYTAVYNYLEAAQFLVNHGALTAIRDKDGKTARVLGNGNSVANYLSAFEG